MNPVGVLDAVALAAFLVAFVLSSRLAITQRGESWMTQARVLFTLALGLYVFVSLSNMLEHLSITEALDPIEDYLEVLFVPLIVYVVFAHASDYHRRQLERANRMLEGEHSMLESIVETSPTGILVTDTDGRITFANERAKDLLGLGDDEGHAGIPTPDWRLRDMRAESDAWSPTGRFLLARAISDPEREVACLLEWPDGRTTILEVNASAMGSTGGALAATVFSVQDATHRMGADGY